MGNIMVPRLHLPVRRVCHLVELLRVPVLLAVSSAVTAGPQSVKLEETPAKTYNEATSPQKRGMHLTVRVPKTIDAGLPVPVQVKIVNNGNLHATFYWDTKEPITADIKVTTKDGKQVPFTLYGRKMIAPTELLDVLDKAGGAIRGRHVHPGQSRDLSMSNLALFYDLTLPGEYVITVAFSVNVDEEPMGEKIMFQVEKIPFTIERPSL
jgi:hypothetical protein